MSEQAKCELCGEPMPPGEEMFKFHGYSGNCPKPPLERFWEITATCENGHTHIVKLDANTFSKAGAEQWAGLLDGSSRFFVHPPGPESVIGKCGICQKPFKCTIKDKPE
ncbi:MAG TPA: hypothetical protein VKS79_21300 [Gemmataceae bacterium]|nr:hypothetical protein [Gemmataceae bacterium]